MRPDPPCCSPAPPSEEAFTYHVLRPNTFNPETPMRASTIKTTYLTGTRDIVRQAIERGDITSAGIYRVVSPLLDVHPVEVKSRSSLYVEEG